MLFYYLIWTVFAFFSLIEFCGLNQRDDRKIFLLLSIFLFFLSFIRWEVGTDWKAYYDFFSVSTNLGSGALFEWGYCRINEIVRFFTNDYTILLFVLGSIIFTFQTLALSRMSAYPTFSLFFLWSVSFGNVLFVRQTIATSILLFSIIYIQKHKKWPFMICIIVATLFHQTSLIFIPAWWLYQVKIKNKWLCIGIIASVLFMAVIRSCFEILSNYVGPLLQHKIDVYLSDSNSSIGAASSFTQIVFRGVLNKISLFSVFLYFRNRAMMQYPYFERLLNLYWFGIILYFSTIGISVVMVRFSFAYDILQVILAAIVFKVISKKENKILFLFIFILYLGIRLYISLVGSYYEAFVPFKTILW